LNRQRRIGIDSGAVKIFCVALAESMNISGRAFSVVFVGTAAMRRLNGEWRKKDRATDVLSFAYGGELVDGLPFLGEIVIAPEIAVLRANVRVKPVRSGRWSVADGRQENCRSIPAGKQDGFGIGAAEREIRKLIVHGALHLTGYDHETDGGEMIGMQYRVLRRRFFTAAPCLIRT